MIAAPKIAKEIAELKLITTVNSSSFTEMLTADMITNRRYQQHLKKLVVRLAERRDEFNTRIEAMGLSVFDRSGGSYYSFLQLPQEADEAQIARNALAKGIFLASGKLLYVKQESRLPAFRVNLARSEDARFYSFFKKETAHLV